jgi:hypothetical protein
MRWTTVGPADQPGTSIVLYPPAATPGITDERRTIFQVIAKGSYFGVNLASPTLDGTCAKLEASGAEVVQEPTEQPYGRSRLRLPRSRGQPDPHPRAPARVLPYR